MNNLEIILFLWTVFVISSLAGCLIYLIGLIFVVSHNQYPSPAVPETEITQKHAVQVESIV
jgi:hypothetical protein